MNSMKLTVFTLTLVVLTHGSPVSSSEKVESLRGANSIDNLSSVPAEKDWLGKSDRITRNFEQQPPLIPHRSQAHRINLDGNRCLTCHGLENYKKRKAVRMSNSHYLDRDGNQLSEVSKARYFCNQCHIEQRDTEPLVGNGFSTAEKAN